MIKQPIPRSIELLERIQDALTPDRLPLLIVIDGADLSGKSSLASWLAWQLGMPAIQLDLYLTTIDPFRWLIGDLKRVVDQRLDNRHPVIIDGVMALDVLDQIGREPDFLVFVKGGHTESSLASQILAYQARQKPQELANFTIDGYAD